ncbi:hypothetical protein BDR26DRAFT_899297 [Obelidium mucronatum]|nr:hypothetical protein BDR26DRAFT_899297 [Obelidium mucronatum]
MAKKKAEPQSDSSDPPSPKPKKSKKAPKVSVPSVSWSDEMLRQLVANVASRYIRVFSQAKNTAEAWMEVAEEIKKHVPASNPNIIHLTGAKCLSRWKKVKTAVTEYTLTLHGKTGTGSEAKDKPPFYDQCAAFMTGSIAVKGIQPQKRNEEPADADESDFDSEDVSVEPSIGGSLRNLNTYSSSNSFSIEDFGLNNAESNGDSTIYDTSGIYSANEDYSMTELMNTSYSFLNSAAPAGNPLSPPLPISKTVISVSNTSFIPPTSAKKPPTSAKKKASTSNTEPEVKATPKERKRKRTQMTEYEQGILANQDATLQLNQQTLKNTVANNKQLYEERQADRARDRELRQEDMERNRKKDAKIDEKWIMQMQELKSSNKKKSKRMKKKRGAKSRKSRDGGESEDETSDSSASSAISSEE